MSSDFGSPRCANRTLSAAVLAFALVAAPALASASASDWVETAKILPEVSEDAEDGYKYPGSALSLDRDTLVVGSAIDRCHPEAPVYVFERDESGSWQQTQTLMQPPEEFEDRDGPWGRHDCRAFGKSVDVDADEGVMAIGDPGVDVPGNVSDHETNAGAVYIYTRKPNGTWELADRFIGPVNGDWNDDSHGPYFGDEVGVHGDVVVATTPDAVIDGESSRGSATVIERADNGTWTIVERLVSSNPQAKSGDHYGLSVSTAEGWIAVGTEEETTSAGSNTGSAHLYSRTDSGWEHRAMLDPSAPGIQLNPRGGCFGCDLDLSENGEHLVVGALSMDHVFGIDATPPGDALALDSGAVFIYDRSDAGWALSAEVSNPEPGVGDSFGEAVAFDDEGERIIVGADEDEADGDPSVGEFVGIYGDDDGSAWILEQTGDGWTCSAKLLGADTSTRDLFGEAVEIQGSTAIVGAPFDANPEDSASDGHGSIYEFRKGAEGPGEGKGGTVSTCGEEIV